MDLETKIALSQLAEMTEAEFSADLFKEAGASLSSRLGMDILRIGGGVATLMANNPTGYPFSRVLGLGWEEPITDELLAEVLGWYRQRGATSIVLQVSPLVPQDDWETVVVRSGFSPGRNWVKCIRETSTPPAIPTDLEVRPMTEADAQRFAEVFCAGFEFEDPLLLEWVTRQPAMSHWRTFGAFDGDSLAAVGALFLYGEFGGMSGAATLSAFRNRGAQAALIAVRIKAAAAEGCKWVVSETGAETSEDPNPSLHNLHRLGFVDLYERRNWLMKFSAGD
jgi:GNAT superfamily N-acetyltransferase